MLISRELKYSALPIDTVKENKYSIGTSLMQVHCSLHVKQWNLLFASSFFETVNGVCAVAEIKFLSA